MSLNHRKDTRTVNVFQHNLLDFHKRERLWISIYAEELRQQKYKVKIEDYGVDNSGKLIKKELKNHNPDYKLCINGEEKLVEVKTIPESSPYFTFKVGSLKACLEHQSYILVPRYGVYYIVGPNNIQYLLDDNEQRLYYNFSPNDISIRITAKKMEKYVENHIVSQYTWGKKAKILIEDNYHILFRKKKT